MTYASVCSGIEAPGVAWRGLGWRPRWFAEIEPFPCAVLEHHYPEVENLGDFTAIERPEPVDLLVAGTPCQSFSVAGQRAGLDDPRGNLTLEWLRLVKRLLPRWVVWENVPGILSDDGGTTFGTILGALGEFGYGFAYRVLDAQYFGVPQRRRRVFIVGHLGGWRGPAAVLFERESLLGHPAASQKAREDVASAVTASAGHHGRSSPRGDGSDNLAVVAPTVPASGRGDFGTDFDLDGGLVLAYQCQGSNVGEMGMLVRRFTPREVERLFGFPDDYTLVTYRGKPASDTARYKALGNSMAVPVMHWIGERIEMVEWCWIRSPAPARLA